MAFSSKSLGTRSGSIDCHDGKASADMMPPRIPRPEIHTSDAIGARDDSCPALYSQPSAAACTSSTACVQMMSLSLIHISEPTRLGMISYAVFCLKKKK